PGLPALGNTHDIARRVIPHARVVYADNDPVVLAHGGEMLSGDDAATVLLADIREPDELLAAVERTGLIDFTAPVGLMMTAVLHFVSDEANPKALIARYMSALAVGSYLAMSHRTTDHKPPMALQTLAEVGANAAGGSYYRTKAQIREMFDGLELVAPYEGAE